MDHHVQVTVAVHVLRVALGVSNNPRWKAPESWKDKAEKMQREVDLPCTVDQT